MSEPVFPAAARSVQVLLPLALQRAYTYAVPAGMAAEPGDYVRVPLGPRQMIGVVWDGEDKGDAIDQAKLRAIAERFDNPAMTAELRRFIWGRNARRPALRRVGLNPKNSRPSVPGCWRW
jgi:primosomal protein N' (replication factor Y)